MKTSTSQLVLMCSFLISEKTGYRGVRQVMSGKWLASYYYRGTVIQLGLFEALDVAVKAYDRWMKATISFFGYC